MGNLHRNAPVVVGIDGSSTGVRAALWAVDEAVSRGVPLRLMSAIDPAGSVLEDEAHRLATAEIAVRYAFTAVEATERPVKLEVEIVQDNPRTALIRASMSATMICVGDVGFGHFTDSHVGSTAKTLAAHAHCPVAIVRDRANHPAGRGGRAVAIIDDAASRHAVLQSGVEEAILRRVPLCVVTMRLPGDDHAGARLNRALAQWNRRHPDLDIDAAAVPGGLLDYLAEHAAETQLIVTTANDGAFDELFSAAGLAAMHKAQCTLVVVSGQRAL